jgi:hypothetical protein
VELYGWVKPFGPFKFTGGIFENTGGLADYTGDIFGICSKITFRKSFFIEFVGLY